MAKYDEYAPSGGKLLKPDDSEVNLAELLEQIAAGISPADPTQVFPNIAFYLTDTGKVGGAYNAIGDYSAAPQEFSIKPDPGQVLRFNRMIVTIEDNGSIDSGGYGNNNSPLSTGIKVECRIQGEPTRLLTAQEPIKRTADWNSLCYDGQVANFGAGNEFYVARWTFTRDGSPIILRENDEIVVILNDDFSGSGQGLLGHKFLIKGEIIE